MRASQLARELWPHLQQYVEPMLRRAGTGTVAGGGGGAGLTAHGLASGWHVGTLSDSQGPQFLLVDGSRALTGSLAVGAGLTVDGVDISAHAGDANAHHNRTHALVGGDHTASGLDVGWVLRANAAASFAWARLLHEDLDPGTRGTNTHGQIDSHIGTANVHVDHTAVTLAAGDGLTGGGTIAANRTFAVGAGTLITVGADTVGVTPGANFQFVGTGSGTAAGWRNVAELAGNGLTAASGVLAVGAGAGLTVAADSVAVGAGTLITVGADDVGVTPGANFQFVGTGSGTAAGWRNVSELAGNGLTAASGVLAVGVANTGAAGLSVEADAVRLTSNSNPGAAAAVLASSASGSLQLVALASNVAFTSGFAGAGYRVDYGVTETGKASAEFDNLTVRGRMRVYELLIQQIRATNGSVFVSSSSRAEVVTEDNDWELNGVVIELNGVEGAFDARIYNIRTRTTTGSGDRNLYHGFLAGDVLRAQRVDVNASGGEIVRQVNLEMTGFVDLWEYVAAYVSGDLPVAGDEMVRLGSTAESTRQGSVYLTADDSGAPFIDIVDEVRSHGDWNTAGKIKARLGRLSGITDGAFGGNLSGYGLYANNVYLKGKIVVTGGNAATTDALSSGLATKIGTGGAAADVNANTTTINGGKITTGSITADKIDVTSLAAINANIGSATISDVLTIGTSGEIRQGTGTLGSNFTGLRVWRESNVGRIGGYNNNVVQWEGATDGRLKAGAGAVVMDKNGVSITAPTDTLLNENEVKWYAGSTKIGRLGTYGGASSTRTLLLTADATGAVNQVNVEAVADGTTRDSVVTLVARSGGQGALLTLKNYDSSDLAPTITLNGRVITMESDGFGTLLVDVTGNMDVNGGLWVGGDSGGKAGTVGLSDVSNTAANSTGKGTIYMKGATNRDSAGFVKIYIGTTAYWVPVFEVITG